MAARCAGAGVSVVVSVSAVVVEVVVASVCLLLRCCRVVAVAAR